MTMCSETRAPLEVSVISSALPGPLADSLTELGMAGICDVDLYCFGESDLLLLKEEGLAEAVEGTNASRLCDPGAVARWISRQVETAEGRAGVKLRPRALATNLAELANPGDQGPDPDLRSSSTQSLGVLLAAALLLDISVVEIVCGRVFYSFGFDNGDVWEYHVRRADSEQVASKFAESLGDALAFAYEAHGESLGSLAVALEVEPGCVYLNSSLDETVRILAQVKKEPRCRLWWNHIGVNLDVGHLLMGGENPSNVALRKLSAGEALLDRVVHMHVSDHSDTHFCDLPVGSLHPMADFEPWLALFAARTARNRPGVPVCSGVVAVELEASQGMGDILSSYSRVRSAVGAPPVRLSLPGPLEVVAVAEVPRIEVTTIRPSVYLCVGSEDDAALVTPLQNALKEAGVDCWIERDEICVGDSRVGKVQQGLSDSEYLVAFVSDALMSNALQLTALNSVLSQQIRTGQKRVLPVLMGEPAGLLERLPLLEGYAPYKWGDGVAGLANIIRKELRRRDLPGPDTD
jgi:sugar phosphate isomerase/epimerase